MRKPAYDTTDICQMTVHTNWWISQYMGLHQVIRRDKLPLTRWFQAKLGRQSYTTRSSSEGRRFWVWERLNWVLYVHNVQGISFEVRQGISEAKARDAWENFLTAAGTSGKETMKEWEDATRKANGILNSHTAQES